MKLLKLLRNKWILGLVIGPLVIASLIQITVVMVTPLASTASVLREWAVNIQWIMLGVRLFLYGLAYILWPWLPNLMTTYRGQRYQDFLAIKNRFFIYILFIEVFCISNVLQYL